MSRELARRVAVLERLKYLGGVRYAVSDKPPADDVGSRNIADVNDRPMTEEEWVREFCGFNGEPSLAILAPSKAT